MQLALFDLDHTLLPIDSDYEWSRFLVRLGVRDEASFQRDNERFYRDYQAGTLDIQAFLTFQLAPLAQYPRATLHAWHDQFMTEVITPQMQPEARALVQQHQRQGDLVALVTATNAFVTAPIARAFGIDHLVATQVEEIDGAYTGRPLGTPSFREGKLVRTDEWLHSLGHTFGQFTRTWFYSDSHNDLPLLHRVSDPVATNPDPRLEATAREQGWPIVRLFQAPRA